MVWLKTKRPPWYCYWDDLIPQKWRTTLSYAPQILLYNTSFYEYFTSWNITRSKNLLLIRFWARVCFLSKGKLVKASHDFSFNSILCHNEFLCVRGHDMGTPLLYSYCCLIRRTECFDTKSWIFYLLEFRMVHFKHNVYCWLWWCSC